MKRYAGSLIVVIFVLGFITMLSTTGVMAEEETIKGIVNEDGEIEDEDGELYTIEENELGNELKALIGKKVEATGTLIAGMYGGFTITVTSYKQIE